MAVKRKIPPNQGLAALKEWLDQSESLPRSQLATAVRFTLEEFAAGSPGNAVELRVPPYGAVQCVPGPRHTRGTPPNVVEMAPATWLELVTGRLTWTDGIGHGLIRASGARADLSDLLPCPQLSPP
ncbi:MAG: sterol carrier family protein [Bifidobacteriaceae bacterium]|jgi:hypothetical protein|nr:sterol carrier family protein [Bifidobacteriaceae bacterium]